MRTMPLFLHMVFLFTGNILNVYPQMNTVKEVDLRRYAGTWYEIARLPNSFEKGLVGVTATYTLRDDGKITVVNQGYRGSVDGRRQRVKGKAKVPDPGEQGRLKVSFFLWFYADYLILDLDAENYQYALVGGGNTNYLWILSRTPQMEEEVYTSLVDKARHLGFEVEKLEQIPQPPRSLD